MSTPSIPGVDRAALADTIAKDQKINLWSAHTVADAALAHIAAHHECACDRAHDDEWVEVDEGTWLNLPPGVRVRRECVTGYGDTHLRRLVHRDDLPDTTKPEGDPMNENTTVVTDRDRTPDPIATINPFRHPWIAGDDPCIECGQYFRDHWWVDAGDHGHTVCDLPQADDEWVKAVYPALHSWATGSSVEGPALVEAARRLLDTLGGDGKPACDRDDADEWVEMEMDDIISLPMSVRVRQGWERRFDGKSRLFVHRDDLPDPDADAANALRDASWSVPRLADGSRPDPLPGLPEARDLLTALREAGWTVTRKGER